MPHHSQADHQPQHLACLLFTCCTDTLLEEVRVHKLLQGYPTMKMNNVMWMVKLPQATIQEQMIPKCKFWGLIQQQNCVLALNMTSILVHQNFLLRSETPEEIRFVQTMLLTSSNIQLQCIANKCFYINAMPCIWKINRGSKICSLHWIICGWNFMMVIGSQTLSKLPN